MWGTKRGVSWRWWEARDGGSPPESSSHLELGEARARLHIRHHSNRQWLQAYKQALPKNEGGEWMATGWLKEGW